MKRFLTVLIASMFLASAAYAAEEKGKGEEKKADAKEKSKGEEKKAAAKEKSKGEEKKAAAGKARAKRRADTSSVQTRGR
jgi:hypothetical protein